MSTSEAHPRLCSIPTSWSKVRGSNDPENPDWQESWRHLADRYLIPMQRYVYWILRSKSSKPKRMEDAEDVVQEWARKSAQKGWAPKGQEDAIRSFRAYIQHQLAMDAIDFIRKVDGTQRRGSKFRRHDESILVATPAANEDAERELNREFVDATLDAALDSLRECNAEHADIIEDMRRNQEAGKNSADFSLLLGIDKEKLPGKKFRARKHFREHFEAALRETVSDEEAFRELWEQLRPFLR